MSTENLNETWAEVKEALLEGLPSGKKEIVSALLENQGKYLTQLTETAASGAISTGNIANFRKTLLPMIRRIIPGTIATEIVGVQPMSGPVAQVYTLRYKYSEAVNGDSSRSQFAGSVNVAAGSEAFGNAVPLKQFYSGTIGSAVGAGASGIANANAAEANIGANTAEGEGWGATNNATTYTTGTTLYGDPVGGSLYGGGGDFIEGSGGRKMSLEIISQVAEATTRKLQAGWTIEAMQDLNSQHGLDIENEMTKALSAEIVQEIDAEIINDLLALAGTVQAYDFSTTSGTTYAPSFVGDRFANLGAVINYVANEIGRKTRRGVGNFIVVSPMVVSVLQSAAKAVFSPAVEGSFKGPNNTMLVGTLNGTIKVYSYLWNQAQPGTSAPAGSDKLLVGYKGGNGEVDSGYFYAPYIPLMSSGVIVNPVTFQPVVSLMTRYAKVVFTDTTTSLGNSADYYGRVNLSNIHFT